MKLPDCVTIQYNPATWQFELKCPYNPYLNEWFKKIGMIYENKHWIFWSEQFDDVIKMLRRCYGTKTQSTYTY